MKQVLFGVLIGVVGGAVAYVSTSQAENKAGLEYLCVTTKNAIDQDFINQYDTAATLGRWNHYISTLGANQWQMVGLMNSDEGTLGACFKR